VIDPVASAPSGSAAGSSTAKPDAVSRGFEQLLVQQLAKELLKTGDTGSEDAARLPSALADAVEDGGGLGLDLDVQGTRS
jgi:hypothetical protein